MLRSLTLSLAVAALMLSGCAKEVKHEAKIYSAGEKVEVGKLTYSVVDSQILPQLGDQANLRMPQNRFIIVQVGVSNSGNADEPIPSMTLVDDAGQTYSELADGTGVPQWLGISRKLSTNETTNGNVVFDAPAKHYRLRLTDEFTLDEVAVDMPLSFVHEELKNMTAVPGDATSK